MTKSVRDLRGDQRTITKTFRGDRSFEKAVDAREEIERLKTDADWLRRKFSEPKSERRTRNLLGHITDSDDPEVIYEPKDDEQQDPAERLRGMSVREWVEAGIHRDPDHPDAVSGYVPVEDPDIRGWIREAFDRQSVSTTRVKVASWGHLRRWGVLSDRSPSDATVEHMRGFRDFLESDPDLTAKESIVTYLKKARQIINGWATRAGVQQPLSQTLDYNRIRGKDPESKVPDVHDVQRLASALERRACEADRWPRRIMVWSIFRVHRLTGARSGELLGLKTIDINRDTQTLHIQRSVDATGELVPTKEMQISGDRTRSKRIPLLDPALEAIDEWLEVRRDLGWAESDLIFCREDGSPWLGRSLWRAYQRGSEAAELEAPISPHQLRHAVNDLLRQHGVGIDIRRSILGHSSDRTNRGYTNVRADEAVDGLQQVAKVLS